MEEFQPGQVIAPGATPEPSVAPASAPDHTPLPQVPLEAQTPPPAPVQPISAPLPSAETKQTAPAEMPLPLSETEEPIDTDDDVIRWVAPEFVQDHKDSTWYGAYTLGTILLAAIIFIFTRDFVSTGVVILAIAGLMVFASRKPGEQQYAFGEGAVQVGNKMYHLEDFKAFSIDEQSLVPSVTLLPLKRFLPPITLYMPSEVEPLVTDRLAVYLPVEQHKLDAVDGLLKRLRF